MMNKSAVITGASKGIGRDVAKHLAQQGFNLLLIARSQDFLLKLEKELKQINSSLYITCAAIDVANREEINLSINDFYKNTSSLDLLFNNAGYAKRGTSEIDPIELVKMININLIGAINMMQAVIPLMKINDKGYIINVSSRSAEIPRTLLGGYAATKAALLAYSEALYKELKNTNIKVTSICPGMVDTEMTADYKEDRSKLIKTSDVCKVIDFLLSLSSSVALKKLSFESITQIGNCN